MKKDWFNESRLKENCRLFVLPRHKPQIVESQISYSYTDWRQTDLQGYLSRGYLSTEEDKELKWPSQNEYYSQPRKSTGKTALLPFGSSLRSYTELSDACWVAVRLNRGKHTKKKPYKQTRH